MTQSLGTVRYTFGQNTARDFKGAINVHRASDGNWSVDGVEAGHLGGCLVVSTLRAYDASLITDAYLDALAGLCWTTNNAIFMGHAIGTVVFVGARGVRRGDGNVEITFKFGIRLGKTDVAVGSITVTSVNGWEYMWVYYGLSADGDGLATKIPHAAYVETLYPSGTLTSVYPA